MRDDPRRNLQWLQQQLMEVEVPESFISEDEDLMNRVNELLNDCTEEEIPAGHFGRGSKAARVEQEHISAQFDPDAAVLTKTKKQLRREAKLRKKAEKNSGVNRNIKGLAFLALLEVLGILAILGWWLQ